MSDTQPTRLLVAEDEANLRLVLQKELQRLGFRVDVVPDGEAALRRLEEGNVDVLLSDINMPRLDGFGVIEYLKNHPPSNKPVVLVITAYADQKFKEVDPNVVAGVLRKPFEVAELGSLVRLCVHGYDAQTGHDLSFASDLRELSAHIPTIPERGSGSGAH